MGDLIIFTTIVTLLGLVLWALISEGEDSDYV